jgi:hypothetical protein
MRNLYFSLALFSDYDNHRVGQSICWNVASKAGFRCHERQARTRTYWPMANTNASRVSN